MTGVYCKNDNGRAVPFSNGRLIEDYYLYFDGERVRQYNIFKKQFESEWPKNYNDIFEQQVDKKVYVLTKSESVINDVVAAL
jgi:hypothetical protein